MTFAPGEPPATTRKSRLAFHTAFSERLLLFSVILQAVDVLVMIVALRHGFFSMGGGPLGRAVGLSPVAVWIILKTSAFMVLVLAALKGRRWLVLALDAWFLAFVLLNLLTLILVR